MEKWRRCVGLVGTGYWGKKSCGTSLKLGPCIPVGFKKDATIGANATIVCGVTTGRLCNDWSGLGNQIECPGLRANGGSSGRADWMDGHANAV